MKSLYRKKQLKAERRRKRKLKYAERLKRKKSKRRIISSGAFDASAWKHPTNNIRRTTKSNVFDAEAWQPKH